jgi:hypothetical protein
MKRSEGVRADRSRLVHCSFAEEALVEAELRKGLEERSETPLRSLQ